jgi:DNA-binding NtrC family response regulator
MSLQENLLAPIFIPKSERYQFIFNLAYEAAKAGLNILIEGETGTGKMMLAEYVHRRVKAQSPLVSINCGGIHSETLSSYLFGHVEGAFTDAKTTRLGKLQLADKGTLFLDEIGNMPLDVQAKILTAIETKCFEPMGSDEKIHSDFLLISATNKSLVKESEQGHFRSDLLYRLRQVHIHLPSLRETPEVIPDFVHFFVHQLNIEYRKNVEISPEKMREWTSRPWPGNIRELHNELRTWVALGETFAKIYNFGETFSQNSRIEPSSLEEKLVGVEKSEIEKTLAQTQFNVAAAARQLNVKRPTLIRHIKKLNIAVAKHRA